MGQFLAELWEQLGIETVLIVLLLFRIEALLTRYMRTIVHLLLVCTVMAKALGIEVPEQDSGEETTP